MSLVDAGMSAAVKGKTLTGKPGRFAPSEPLHMTTRRAAKTTTTNGSPSINGSFDDDDSRRGSLDDSRPVTSHSNGSQISTTNSRRPSDVSLTNLGPATTMNGLSFSGERTSENAFAMSTPTLDTPPPGRKRKRSTSPLPSQLVEPPQSLGDAISSRLTDQFVVNDVVEEEEDTVDLIPPEDLSDRDDASQTSSRFDEETQLESFDVQSIDVTPVQSNPATPPSRESDYDEEMAVVKPSGASPEDAGMTELEEGADATEEMDVDVEADVPDEGDDADVNLQSDDDERPHVRRFGGRRRAQHPIPKVERAMQRQAELKSAYRAIARQQKLVLAEIAQRTVDDLASTPDLHTRAAEHPSVQQGIDDALEERRNRLKAQVQWNMEQLQATLHSQQEALKAKCRQQFDDLKEERLAQMEHQMLRIARDAQLNSIEGQYDTEDEDDVIPKPKRVCYGFKRPSVPLEDVYFSRSRELMETARTSHELERRYEMRKLLDGIEGEERPAAPKNFTIMDGTPHRAAVMKRQAAVDLATLAKAARQVSKSTKKIPVIRNEDARGLLLLGDLASRPSITTFAQESVRSKLGAGLAPRRASVRPMQPQLQIQTNYRNSPIQLDMSPRTTQALGDRYEPSMLPPMTPHRRAMSSLAHSPEILRPESTLQSPASNFSHFSNAQPQPTRTPDVRPETAVRSHFIELGRDRPLVEPRPQSEQRLDPHFSPAQSNGRIGAFPLWREFAHDPPAGLHRRSFSQQERPQFEFGTRLPGREERPLDTDRRMQDAQKAQELAMDKPAPFGQLNGRQLLWQDRSSQPGAPDARFQTQDQRTPIGLQQRPTGDAKSPPNPPNQTMTFVRDFRSSGILPKDDPNRARSKGPISGFKQKTNKEERDGLSRRSWTNQRKLSQPVSAAENANSPPLAPAVASSPVPHPPVPWLKPAQSQPSPFVPPPPTASYQQSPYSQPPPAPPTYRPTQSNFEQFANRSGFPPRPASSTNVDRLPPTPLYVMPPQQQQSHHQQQQQQQSPPPPQQQQQTPSQAPPPGAPSEQYNRPFAPPPQPGYQPPVPPAPTPQQAAPAAPQPQSPYTQTAPGSYNQSHFGGPPLAPAGGNAYHAPGFRPAPAFAQQAQQQQQNGSAGRRRTQSDASQLTKFQPWTPPVGKR